MGCHADSAPSCQLFKYPQSPPCSQKQHEQSARTGPTGPTQTVINRQVGTPPVLPCRLLQPTWSNAVREICALRCHGVGARGEHLREGWEAERTRKAKSQLLVEMQAKPIPPNKRGWSLQTTAQVLPCV